jgi:C-terminal processing protease CtpA/Prc
MVRIAEVLPDSIADELHLRIGSRIVRINGEPVRDTIDLRFLEAEGRVELEVHDAAGDAVLYEIEKDPARGWA